MKKITKKRIAKSKGGRSRLTSAARLGAAIPLCLLMLGGHKALAGGGSSGGDAVGIVDGVPLMGEWALDDTDTGVTPLFVGVGGNAAATNGGQGGGTIITGAPTATADIVFNGAIGGDGSNSAAGGDSGGYFWERTAAPLTVNSIMAGGNRAGNGGDAATAMTIAGNGGASSGLTLNFGAQTLTLAGVNALTSYALDLTAGSGGNGGVTYANSVSAAGNGGVGGDVSLTAGLLSFTDDSGLAAAALFVAGGGGFAGNGPTAPDDAANVAAKSGDGGAGGAMNIVLSGISFVSAGVPPGPDAPPDTPSAGNDLTFHAGDAGYGMSGGDASAAHGGLTGQAGGSGGAGGALSVNVTGAIDVKARMELDGGTGGDGFDGGAGAVATASSAIGGAGGAGGAGGKAVLNSGSVNVGGNLHVFSGLSGNSGNGGDGGFGASAGIVGHGGAGGVGGVGGDAELNSLGAITVGSILILDASASVGGGKGGDAGSNEFAHGGDGAAAGAAGAVSVRGAAISAESMLVFADGFDGGAGGNSTGINFIAGNGGAGASGGAVSLSAAGDIVIAEDVFIGAPGGDGGDGGDGVGFAAGNGGAGGAGGDVLITARNFRIGGALDLRNETGADGVASSNAAAGYGLAGQAGAGGSIRLDAMVSASEITGTVGQTYAFGGLELDRRRISFTEDYSYPDGVATPGSGAVVGADTALYTIGIMRVTGANRILEADNLAKLNVGSFDFVLPKGVKAGDVILQANNISPTPGGADDLQITGATGLTIGTQGRLRNLHRDLGSITLIDGEVDGINTIAGRRINDGIYSWVVEEGSLVIRLAGIPGFDSYSQTGAVRLAFVADGLNHVVASGIRDLDKATDGDGVGIVSFASVYGGKNSYDTGGSSDFDLEGMGFMVGVGFGANVADGQRLIAGAFMEGGWGNYDSSSNGFNADGDTSYLGVGIMGKYAFPTGMYFDASARGGSAKIDFGSYDLGVNGGKDNLDSTRALYYGGHVGAGYEWVLNDKSSVDFSARMLWTHLDSDNAKSSYGDRVHFESADSFRSRTGARYNQAFDLGADGILRPFVGVAYEYEFAGDAGAKVDGRSTDREASIGGGTAIGEVGVFLQATDRFSLELAAQGNAFTREGGGGSLRLKWRL